MGHYYYFLFILSDAVLRKLLLYSLQTLYFSEQHYRHLSIYMQNTRIIKYKFHPCHLVVLYLMTILIQLVSINAITGYIIYVQTLSTTGEVYQKGGDLVTRITVTSSIFSFST